MFGPRHGRQAINCVDLAHNYAAIMLLQRRFRLNTGDCATALMDLKAKLKRELEGWRCKVVQLNYPPASRASARRTPAGSVRPTGSSKPSPTAFAPGALCRASGSSKPISPTT